MWIFMGIKLSEWAQKFQAIRLGSGATRDRASQTFRALSDFCDRRHWRDVTPNSITPKQMRLFLQHRLTVDKISARSLQNEASHLRRCLEGAGRQLGDIKQDKNAWSSSRMGVPEGSRIGARAAINPEVFKQAREKVTEGVRDCLDVQSVLGLRRQEAVECSKSLKDWVKALDLAKGEGRGVFLEVIYGTKTGRERTTWVPPERIDAVQTVVCEVLERTGGGFLIPADSLEQAKAHYSDETKKAGMIGDNSGHGLRRAFAHEQYRHYRDTGLDEAEALARVSRDLGHGDGRGRWVWNNYLSGGEG
jgi:integrase